MGERRCLGRSWGRCFARASGLAVVAIFVLSTGVAHAEAFSLPDGQKVAPGVTITRVGETANVLPSLARNNQGRSVYVSGNVSADVTRDIPEGCLPVYPFNFQCPNNEPLIPAIPGTTNSQTHGASQLNTGYIIGCQVSIASDAVSLGISASISLTNGVGAGFGIGVNIGPGEVKFVQINFKDIVKPGHYGIGYQGMDINIQGCGGRAQARAYTTVEIIGNDYGKYSLYGQPFDIP